MGRLGKFATDEERRLNRNKTKREYRAKNKERTKEIVKKSRAKNKEKIIIAQKKYRAENKETIRVSAKKYRTENADAIKAYFKIYNPKNKLALSERRRKHYLRNKERTLLINSIWLKNNREVRTKQQNAYSKKRRKSDPLFKLADVMRTRLRSFLSTRTIKKSKQKTVKI